ncbi:cadherin-1 isoform X2 [Danio rerio]
MDGTLMMRRSVTLHEGLKEFSVFARDSSGKKHMVSVRVEHVRYHEDHDMNTLMNTSSVQMESPYDDLVLTFPKSLTGLKRLKRGWIVPPISISENSRGPFPKRLVQIMSEFASETRMAYKVTGEGADLDPKGIFQIDRLSGWISVTQKLDREQKASYKLVAHATGVDVNIANKPMEIYIIVTDQNDNKPVFTQNPFKGHVPEAAGKGEVFMTVTATDADDKENTDNADISYAIISQDPPSPKPNMFAINPVSGGISMLETGLDREQWSSYTLVITATDMNGEGGSTTGTAIITVTDSNNNAPNKPDNKPVFTQNPFNGSVPETAGKGEVFMTVTATYADDKENTDNVDISYAIISQDPPSPKPNMFAINPLSGGISVLETGLDREQWSRYTLVITATDRYREGLSTTGTAVIAVADSNDNAPLFASNWVIPPISVLENSKGPFPVRLVQINTNYAAETQMEYKITGEGADMDPKGIFQIDKLSGWISVTQPLDREKKGSYHLVAHAKGLDGDIKEKPMWIAVTVIDQNDNKPVFTQSLINGNVPEAAGKGEVFMTVTATDADDKENSNNADISYSIISQDPPSPKPNMFAINPVSGGISVLETGLDREQWSRYTLVVMAADMNGEGLSTTATAVITVTDPAV